MERSAVYDGRGPQDVVHGGSREVALGGVVERVGDGVALARAPNLGGFEASEGGAPRRERRATTLTVPEERMRRSRIIAAGEGGEPRRPSALRARGALEEELERDGAESSTRRTPGPRWGTRARPPR